MTLMISSWTLFGIKNPATLSNQKVITSATQRNDLNNYGWSLLPENCTYSTNHDDLIELVTEGDLSRDFLDNWIKGKTALMAWW